MAFRGPLLANIVTQFPSSLRTYSQDYLLTRLLTRLPARQHEFAKNVYDACGIQSRGLLMADESESDAQHNYILHQRIVDLASASMTKLMYMSNISLNDVDHVFHMTSHQFPMASISLAERLKLKSSGTNLAPMGCIAGLKLMEYALKHPKQPLVATTTEVLSEYWARGLTHVLKDEAKQRNAIVASALFGDAGASMYFVDELPGARGVKPRILDCVTKIIPRTRNAVTSHYGFDGMNVNLSRDLPKIAAENVESLVQELLVKCGLTCPSEVKFWVIHPGSQKIVKDVGNALKLTPEQLEFSLRSLRRHGNCASASVIHGVQSVMNSGLPKKGDKMMAIGIGPGTEMMGVGFCFE